MGTRTIRWLASRFRPLHSTGSFVQRSRSPKPKSERKYDYPAPKNQNLVTTSTEIYNLIGCLVAAALYFYLTLYWSDYLYPFVTILTVYLAEYCGWDNERVRTQRQRHQKARIEFPPDADVAEKGEHYEHLKSLSDPGLGCIAAIVGYREDPTIFTKALESYSDAEGCQFVLTCIDGNEPKDQVMVDIFRKVYPTRSAFLNLPVPPVDIALQIDRDTDTTGHDTTDIEECVALVKRTLLEHQIHLTGPDSITHLCVTQPHMHKKGIMFTSFVICFALSGILDIEYVWTSDEDSMVYKDTIKTTIETIYGDDKCAGASTALNIHNREDNLVTTLEIAIYLNNLHLS